jgi:HlyD family secretion protein
VRGGEEALRVWKWILGLLILVVVGTVIGGVVLWKLPASQEFISKLQGKPKATIVKLETIEKGDLTRSISAPGTVDARTRVKVSAQVSARITALPFREGQDVKAGDVVVRLDAEELQANMDSARAGLRAEEARLEGTQAALVRSKSELERVRSLHRSKDRSDAELEAIEAAHLQQESALRVAEQSIESSRAQVRRAERDLSNSIIASPIDGTITLVNNEVGELVLGTFNNLGQTILEIADLTEIIMRAEVDEGNIQQVKPGQLATVFVTAYPEREFPGRVDKVRPQKKTSPRDGRNYFEVEITLELKDDEKLLLVGGLANCDIHVETMYDVLKVPSQAVLDRRLEELPSDIASRATGVGRNKAFARVVYIIENGKTRVVPVTAGSSDLRSTIVLQGLEPGTKVITGPYKVLATLKHDQAVEEEKPPEIKQGETAAAAAAKPAEDVAQKPGEAPAAGSN